MASQSFWAWRPTIQEIMQITMVPFPLLLLKLFHLYESSLIVSQRSTTACVNSSGGWCCYQCAKNHIYESSLIVFTLYKPSWKDCLLAYIFFAMLMCSILSISIISEKKTKLTRKTIIYIINFVYITMFTLHIISSFRF